MESRREGRPRGLAGPCGPGRWRRATQRHSATFTGAGGNASYGTGDTRAVPLVQGFLPLFDGALGTLDSVDVTLTGWRSLDFSCHQGLAGTMDGCNASINGRFVLGSITYPA